MKLSSASLSSSSEEALEEDKSSESSEGESDVVAKKANKAVAWQRGLVLLILAAAAVTVSIVVFSVTKDSELEEFQAEFSGKVLKIMSEFHNLSDQKFKALGSLSVTITAFVLGREGAQFPFVDLNNFQEQGETIRRLSGALYVEFMPMVQKTELSMWSEFVENTTVGWLEDTLAYKEHHKFLSYNSLPGLKVPPTITAVNSSSEDCSNTNGCGLGEVYFPVWESSPVGDVEATRENLQNFHPISRALKVSATEGNVAIGNARTAPAGGIDSEDELTRFMAYLKSVRDDAPSNYTGEPIGSVYFPVFETFLEHRKPRGVVLALFLWSTYLSGILPDTTPPITAVLHNECDGYVRVAPHLD